MISGYFLKLLTRPNNFLRAVNVHKMRVEKPLENSMRTKLKEKLNPVYLDVINESYMHNVPDGAETHFKVVVVSNEFVDKPLLQRHRMVNEALEWELENGIHALSIMAKTPEQWEASDKAVTPSPNCRGGFGK